MQILVAGANGKVARRLLPRLADRGHRVRGLVRDRSQADSIRELGAEPVIGDLEADCSEHLADCNVVCFCAGSGPHTGPDKTLDVDRDGATRLIDAAAACSVSRFVMLSAMRNESDAAIASAPEKLQHYLRAKKAADDHLRATPLDWRIAKPGRLTEDAGTGHIRAAEYLGEYGEIPRDDVAAILAELVDRYDLVQRQVEFIGGQMPISDALDAL